MPKNCVLIPFKENCDNLLEVVSILKPQCGDHTVIALMDDGSQFSEQFCEEVSQCREVVFLRSGCSCGPAMARNRGVAWCRTKGIELLILLDSDCVPGSTFIETHLEHHRINHESVCIGGGIEGVGKGLWARLDKLASWFTSMPQSAPRIVKGLYHIPTTNMSLKLDMLPFSGDLFDDKLKTGEDVRFIQTLEQENCEIRFFPDPSVKHKDRERMYDFLRHQYRWGLHTYSVRFKTKHSLLLRSILAMAFIPGAPFFALLACLINMKPLLQTSFKNCVWFAPLYLVYLVKSVAVLQGILRPDLAVFGAEQCVKCPNACPVEQDGGNVSNTWIKDRL